jgi:hypothetical protein
MLIIWSDSVGKAESQEEWVVSNLLFFVIENIVAAVFVVIVGARICIEEAAASLSLVIVGRRQRIALGNQRCRMSAALD